MKPMWFLLDHSADTLTLLKYPILFTGTGFLKLSKFDLFGFCLKLHILGSSKKVVQTGALDLIHCNIMVHGDIMGHNQVTRGLLCQDCFSELGRVATHYQAPEEGIRDTRMQ